MNYELKSFLDSYHIIFDATQGLAAAIFGLCVFLVVRRTGLVNDEDLAVSGAIWPLVLAATFSLASIILSFLSIGAVQNFYSVSYKYQFRVEVEGKNGPSALEKLDKEFGCVSVLTKEWVTPNEPSHFFDECIRGEYVSPLVKRSLSSLAVSIVTLFCWFLVQVRLRKVS
jgi:hypothetical protein